MRKTATAHASPRLSRRRLHADRAPALAPGSAWLVGGILVTSWLLHWRAPPRPARQRLRPCGALTCTTSNGRNRRPTTAVWGQISAFYILGIPSGRRAGQRDGLAHEVSGLHRPVQGHQQFPHLQRFLEITIGAEHGGFDCGLGRAVGPHQQGGDAGLSRIELADQLQPARAGQAQAGQDRVEGGGAGLVALDVLAEGVEPRLDRGEQVPDFVGDAAARVPSVASFSWRVRGSSLRTSRVWSGAIRSRYSTIPSAATSSSRNTTLPNSEVRKMARERLTSSRKARCASLCATASRSPRSSRR